MATDTTLRPGEIKDILLREIEAADLAELEIQEVGTVLEVRDGIARIYGLEKAMAGEMLEITSSETGEVVTALALNLEEDNIGAVILGDYLVLREGDDVRRTSRVLEVPVGPALVGRVVDALGRPIDGLGEVRTTVTRKVESPAPGIIVRQPVKEPLQTGIKAVDSMIPIGRGQRELIIGDRGIGKTAIARRYDHQSEGHRRHLRLRRDRPESLDRAIGGSEAARRGRDGVHDHRQRFGVRSRLRCSTSRLTRAARWRSTSCITRASQRSACTTI